MSFTPAQLRAIVAAGNVLVMAGAGTGKTRTLVERCVRRLLAPTDPVSLEAILMVTFTEAAASEMRQRIRARLEAELDAQPENARLAEQLALLDSARICTLHSFCLELVREHFHELALDPQVTVLDPDQARLLAAETLNEMFRAHYAADSPESDAVRQLVEEHGGGRDQPIRELILRLHEFTQTRPDPEGWFARELERFAQTDPLVWRQWLHAGFETWRQRWQPCLRAQAAENANAHTCAAWLEGAGTTAGWDAKTCLQQILATSRSRPRGQKGRSGPPLTKFYEEATFLDSLLAAPGAPDPLAEDWSWVRTTMATLLRLAREFAQSFAQAKRNAGRIDFHDLEQFALRLLWNATTGRPTPVASRWRERLQLVFVDEYQDINPAQDAILAALSREGADANRFLVGDVKQSIYRFRQAAPHIFQGYAERWRQQPEAQVIALCDNFRSAEPILRFLNAFFAGHFRPEAGGVTYDEQAR
ncbi:MAG TPA: UvrD-helicase domain-containing protein, partial [Methylomirabilota bacterium]|nr:UvrD-helicase domain-containing protein [Methylomirabilota bacterium]